MTVVCAASFLPTTSPTLLLALLAAFAAAQLAFAALLAAPLGNAKVAGVLAPAAHFACLLPRYAFFRTSDAQVRRACLLRNQCFRHCRRKTGAHLIFTCLVAPLNNVEVVDLLELVAHFPCLLPRYALFTSNALRVGALMFGMTKSA